MKSVQKLGVILGVLLMLSFTASAGIVHQVEGYGTTPSSAREQALALISQFFESTIDSRAEQSMHVRHGEVSETMETQIKVVSKSFLKGVTYGEARATGEGYVVEAVITRAALNDTIHFLSEAVSQLKYDRLSPQQIHEKLAKIAFLKTLETFVTDKSVIELAKSVENILLKYLNQARVSFDLVPAASVLVVNGKKYANNAVFFLVPGTHQMQVSHPGYRSDKRRLYVSKGQKLNKHIALVPLNTADIRMVIISNENELKASAKKVLLDHDVVVSPDNTGHYAIRFKLTKKPAVEIDGMSFFNVKVTAHLLEGGREVLVKKVSLKNKTAAYIESKQSLIAKKLTQALLKSYALKSGLAVESYR
jgi:hypothetical protein